MKKIKMQVHEQIFQIVRSGKLMRHKLDSEEIVDLKNLHRIGQILNPTESTKHCNIFPDLLCIDILDKCKACVSGIAI